MLRSNFLVSLIIFSLAISIAKAGSYRKQPYCGLYCLYSAMKLENIKIDFQELLKPEYIGSKKGSSLAELKKAGQDNGMYAETVANLSVADLRELSQTIILHVKSKAESDKYDHYKLFLGTKGGKARLFDPPSPVELVSFHELATLWDGTGLIISDKPIDLGKVFGHARKLFLLCTAIAIAIILLVQVVTKRWRPVIDGLAIHKRLGLSVVQGGGLIAMSLLAGLVFHFVSEAGFLANANATASIERGHIGDFLPKLSNSEVRQGIGAGAILIDARYEQDYKAGHIERAINIPVSLCDAGRQSVLAKTSKDAKIVVYCQSAGCKYAETVAGKLKSDGFADISIYKDGWQGWEQSQKGNKL